MFYPNLIKAEGVKAVGEAFQQLGLVKILLKTQPLNNSCRAQYRPKQIGDNVFNTRDLEWITR